MWPFGERKQTVEWRIWENTVKKQVITKYKEKGYKCKSQKVSRSTGKRPDFFLLKSKHDRIVVEAKWCIKAMKSHLDQILSYKGNPFYCQKGVLVYPSNVQLPRGFKEQAENRAVEVVILPVEKQKRGVFNKKYIR